MKKLSDILKNIKVKSITGNPDVPVNKIYADSRIVTPNSVFIAQKGENHDSHNYIEDVIKAGAVAIICEKLPATIHDNITYALINNTVFNAGFIADSYFEHPSSKIKVIGITGTNGKTTIATLLYRLYRRLGFRAGLISTIVNYIDSKAVASTHTTPDAITVHKLLSKMAEAGCKYCFMEVSSHAVVQHRINGVRFAGGIFTNLTHDHLDYHKDFASYLKAKKQFFDNLGEDAFALTNTDDKNGKVMVQNTKARVATYALHTMADYKAAVLEYHFNGTKLKINNREVWTQLLGKFNAVNALAVYGAGMLLGSDEEKVLTGLSDLQPVSGRSEYLVSSAGYVAIVDYAHTPDALLNILGSLKSLLKNEGRIITVAGAGGNRDKTKRPEMGKIASENSSLLVLTSDNPRNEDPAAIINEMKAGVRKEFEANTLCIADRKEAIKTACRLAGKDDIVLVAGKGHETYQEIKGVKHFFDDKEILKEIFKGA